MPTPLTPGSRDSSARSCSLAVRAASRSVMTSSSRSAPGQDGTPRRGAPVSPASETPSAASTSSTVLQNVSPRPSSPPRSLPAKSSPTAAPPPARRTREPLSPAAGERPRSAVRGPVGQPAHLDLPVETERADVPPEVHDDVVDLDRGDPAPREPGRPAQLLDELVTVQHSGRAGRPGEVDLDPGVRSGERGVDRVRAARVQRAHRSSTPTRSPDVPPSAGPGWRTASPGEASPPRASTCALDSR